MQYLVSLLLACLGAALGWKPPRKRTAEPSPDALTAFEILKELHFQ